jgi:hypothetical protein
MQCGSVAMKAALTTNEVIKAEKICISIRFYYYDRNSCWRGVLVDQHYAMLNDLFSSSRHLVSGALILTSDAQSPWLLAQ